MSSVQQNSVSHLRQFFPLKSYQASCSVLLGFIQTHVIITKSSTGETTIKITQKKLFSNKISFSYSYSFIYFLFPFLISHYQHLNIHRNNLPYPCFMLNHFIYSLTPLLNLYHILLGINTFVTFFQSHKSSDCSSRWSLPLKQNCSFEVWNSCS